MSETTILMRLRNASRHYVMGANVIRALDNVDLDVARGEFVMVVGSSGSGKSTLMDVLGCLDTPTAGSYEFDGRDVARMDDESLSRMRNRCAGFVFQQFNLLPNLTVAENIALPLAYAGVPPADRAERARRQARLLGIEDRLLHRPTELSGGQSQRVAIARALVNEPDVILADEPTGNLDSATGRDIMNILLDLNARGYTILMVTHDPKYAEEGTRKITLSDGRIVGDVSRPGTTPIREKAAGSPAREGGISLRDLLRVGIRQGLLAHKMRTALTMLGIVIGVAGVIAMSSFSLGSKKKQADQIRALGANLVRIVDERLEGEKLSAARIAGSPGLRLADMELARSAVPGIRRIAAVREIKLNVVHDRAEVSPRILGVTGDYLEVNNLRMQTGRFLDAEDRHRSARVAVVGHAVARALGGTNAVGQTLVLSGVPYSIVGVLADRHVDLKDLEATGATDANQDLLVPLEAVLSRTKHLDLRSQIDEIQLQLEDENMLYRAGTALRRLLTAAHEGVEDFRLVVPLDLLKQKEQAQRLLDILTICIASVSLIVGGIGIMNIMLASVRERIREIGVRRAVGASRRDVRYQFLSESVLISATGGLIGILASLVVVTITCAALRLPIVVSPFMVVLAVTAATATGLGFGLYPAAQAAARDPVESLRYE